MIKLPYNDILAKIKAGSLLSEEEIDKKIKAKMDQLAGLISKEGAAHIIANELGVKLFEDIQGRMKIKSILSGMKTVETVGKITNVFEVKEFNKKDGSKGKLGAFIIGDETGTIRVVLWNDQADMLKGLKQGDIVKIKDAYVKDSINNNVELHMSSKGELTINPKGEKIDATAAPQMQRQKSERKKIESLKETDNNIELMATIVQAFEPRFYEVCPECSKRIRLKDTSFVCDTHGEVIPGYGYVMNVVMDDGTGTIRTVFFRNQVLNLLKMENHDILKFKDNPADFQTVKEELVGKTVKVVGRTSKNEMFSRLEFVSQLVFPDPDPDEELKRLEEEAKAIE